MTVEKRTVNIKVLRAWLKKNAPNAKEKLISRCDHDFSVYAVDKWLSYKTAPRPANQAKAAKVIGVEVDELFPVIKRRTA